MEAYDSTADTLAHIARVASLLAEVTSNLTGRAGLHDHSKLLPPEKEIFDIFTPKLRETTYGSGQYKQDLAEMGEGLKHHYAVNSHHPEHRADGIRGMSLLDVVEMLADWKAATERHADGDLRASIVRNQERFRYTDELRGILLHTAEELGWL